MSHKTFVPPPTEHKARVFRPRLYATYYYASTRDKAENWLRVGHACTPEGAVRASIMKLLLKVAMQADIYNNDGVRVAVLQRKGNTIKVVASWL